MAACIVFLSCIFGSFTGSRSLLQEEPIAAATAAGVQAAKTCTGACTLACVLGKTCVLSAWPRCKPTCAAVSPTAACGRANCSPQLCPSRACSQSAYPDCKLLCNGVPVVDPLACPAGVPLVQCFRDPCQGYVCPAGKTCRSDYCGGCYARCV